MCADVTGLNFRYSPASPSWVNNLQRNPHHMHFIDMGAMHSNGSIHFQEKIHEIRL